MIHTHDWWVLRHVNPQWSFYTESPWIVRLQAGPTYVNILWWSGWHVLCLNIPFVCGSTLNGQSITATSIVAVWRHNYVVNDVFSINDNSNNIPVPHLVWVFWFCTRAGTVSELFHHNSTTISQDPHNDDHFALRRINRDFRIRLICFNVGVLQTFKQWCFYVSFD